MFEKSLIKRSSFNILGANLLPELVVEIDEQNEELLSGGSNDLPIAESTIQHQGQPVIVIWLVDFNTSTQGRTVDIPITIRRPPH